VASSQRDLGEQTWPWWPPGRLGRHVLGALDRRRGRADVAHHQLGLGEHLKTTPSGTGNCNSGNVSRHQRWHRLLAPAPSL